jgi:carboxymethylenebutenolidase
MGLAALAVLLLAGPGAAGPAGPETIHFPSADGATTLVGYLFRPDGGGPHPAVVMLHGRSGPYSSRARGIYTSATLSGRHLAWAQFWQEQGYVALVVDSFGPRGYPAGFPRGSHRQRPAAVSEQTVRPLDAYGALAHLRGRRDIDRDRIGLQGWSNGAMTAMVAMSDTTPGLADPTAANGFRAAVALYPGCAMEHVSDRWVRYAPVLMLIAADDDEVSPARGQELATRTQATGAPVELVVYEGAEHNFDDPGRAKQSRDANRRATADARNRARRFFQVALERATSASAP